MINQQEEEDPDAPYADEVICQINYFSPHGPNEISENIVLILIGISTNTW
jgi:hypothetical protein